MLEEYWNNLLRAGLVGRQDHLALLLVNRSDLPLLDPLLLANSTVPQKSSNNFLSALTLSCLADFASASSARFASSSEPSSQHSFSASSMNCCIDNKVRVPRTLRTEVPIFEKDGETPPPEGRSGALHNGGSTGGQATLG